MWGLASMQGKAELHSKQSHLLHSRLFTASLLTDYLDAFFVFTPSLSLSLALVEASRIIF